MHPRRPAAPRHHHPLASPRGHLRAAQRLAGGLRKAAVARVERVDEAEIDALLAHPDFRELLDALAALEALPEEERLRYLERLAWFTLERALADDDWRCAAFILAERRMGRNPARTLAHRAMARQRRAAQPTVLPAPETGAAAAAAPASQPSSARHQDPAAQVVARAGAALRDAVVHEHAVRHAAEAAADAPAAAPPPAPAAAPRPRRLDGLAARLRSGAAAAVAEPQAAPVKSLLRARAQGR